VFIHAASEAGITLNLNFSWQEAEKSFACDEIIDILGLRDVLKDVNPENPQFASVTELARFF